LFLKHESVGSIGTTTAWDGKVCGEMRERIHWVEIIPAFQGQGLSKPLLSAALTRLTLVYRRAYLTAETTSYREINLYLSFDFMPDVTGYRDREGWEIVEEIAGRTIGPRASPLPVVSCSYAAVSISPAKRASTSVRLSSMIITIRSISSRVTTSGGLTCSWFQTRVSRPLLCTVSPRVLM
jgi:hypothetical protein